MNTRFSVSNFRAFDEKGVSIDIRPITILTGCNSSGKSSLTKSIVLLSDFLNVVTKNRKEPARLNFEKKPSSLLGNFESVLNFEAKKLGDNSIRFSYEVDTPIIGEPLVVSLVFELDEKDLKKNGFLKSIVISDRQGKILLSSYSVSTFRNYIYTDCLKESIRNASFDYGNHNSNLSCFKQHFFSFAIAISIFDKNVSAALKVFEEGYRDDDEWKSFFRQGESTIKQLLKKYNSSTIKKALSYFPEGELSKFVKFDFSHIEKAAEYDIVTYLPILNELDSVGKNQFPSFFRQMCEKDVEMKHRVLPGNRLESIITAFVNSSFDSFSDYYRSLENQYLNERMNENDISDAEERFRRITDNITFEMVFRVLCEISFNRGDKTSHILKEEWEDELRYTTDLLQAFKLFRSILIKAVFSSDICEHLSYVGSSRVEVKRLYTFDTQDSFSRVVSDYLESIRVNSSQYRANSFLNKWIRRFNLGDRFEVVPLENGLGYVLKIFETENDSEGKLLADFGYGITQLISILIEIETGILKAKTRKNYSVVNKVTGEINLEAGGFYRDYSESILPSLLIIEEPEIHLHPDYQALLANMFYEAHKDYNINFIIETHSEYLIRRCQILFKKGVDSGEKNPFSIYYFPKGEKPYEMVLSNTGHFENKFGDGFYDAAARDALELSRMSRK